MNIIKDEKRDHNKKHLATTKYRDLGFIFKGG